MPIASFRSVSFYLLGSKPASYSLVLSKYFFGIPPKKFNQIYWFPTRETETADIKFKHLSRSGRIMNPTNITNGREDAIMRPLHTQ